MAKVSQVVFVFALGLVLADVANAEVRTKTVDYQQGGTQLEGFLAWDDSAGAARPGVLVVHEWWGLNDYARSRAKQLAEQGYVAFALDMYGAGKATSHPDQAAAWMKQIQTSVDQWVQRAAAGLEVLKQQEGVDPDKLAAIGYCFGGATVMHMAYSGLDLDLVASFHGSLPVPEAQTRKTITSRVLVAHGNADPFVPADKVAAFKQALEDAGADWTMIEFGGAKHGFTNPSADQYGLDALAYDQEADRQSWQMLLWTLADSFD